MEDDEEPLFFDSSSSSSSSSSSFASSSSSSSAFYCSFSEEPNVFDISRFDDKKRESVLTFRCAFCEYEYNRLEYPFGTCTPECGLTYCRDNPEVFNALYANLQSRFSMGRDYFPRPIPDPCMPRSNESKQDFSERCTIQCYGTDSCRERSVREGAIEYALSSDVNHEK